MEQIHECLFLQCYKKNAHLYGKDKLVWKSKTRVEIAHIDLYGLE